MKLQILSDTHGHEYSLDPLADIVVHAGDAGNGLIGFKELYEKCLKENKPLIFAPGNHDYYHGDINIINKFFKDNFNDTVLHGSNVIEKNGITFVGGTLFTNFRSNRYPDDKAQIKKNKDLAQHYINDFHIVNYKKRRVTPNDYQSLFKKQYDLVKKYIGKENTVVVSHFPPHIDCLDPYWGTHPEASVLNPYFINDLDLEGFKTWIAGHTHTAVDTISDGCRVVINPLGYATEHGKNGFVPLKTIEI